MDETPSTCRPPQAPSREHAASLGNTQMNTALHRLFVLLLLALRCVAEAGDAANYANASLAQQAKLLECWAVAPIPERLQLIEALRANRVAIARYNTP